MCTAGAVHDVPLRRRVPGTVKIANTRDRMQVFMCNRSCRRVLLDPACASVERRSDETGILTKICKSGAACTIKHAAHSVERGEIGVWIRLGRLQCCASGRTLVPPKGRP